MTHAAGGQTALQPASAPVLPSAPPCDSLNSDNVYAIWALRPVMRGEQWQALMQDWPRATAGMDLDDALLTRFDEAERLNRTGAASRFQRCPEARMEFEPKAQGGQTVRAVVRTVDGDETTPLHLDVPEAMTAPFRWLAAHAAAFPVAELASHFPTMPLAQHLGIVNALVRARYLRQLWYSSIPDR